MVTKSVLTIVENKIASNRSKHLLVENKLKNVKNLDSSYFLGKSHFDGDGVQSYFVFQSITRYFKVNTFNNIDYVLSWKSKGLSAESIKPPSPHNNDPTLKNCLFGAVTLTKNVVSLVKMH